MPNVTDTLDNQGTASYSFSAERIASSLVHTSVCSPSSVVGYPDNIVNQSVATPRLSAGRELIPRTDIVINGVAAPNYITADQESNAYFENLDGRTVIQAVSSSPITQTLTFLTSFEQDDLDLEDRVVTIDPGETIFVGPFPQFIYNQDLINVYVDISLGGVIQFRAFRLI